MHRSHASPETQTGREYSSTLHTGKRAGALVSQHVMNNNTSLIKLKSILTTVKRNSDMWQSFVYLKSNMRSEHGAAHSRYCYDYRMNYKLETRTREDAIAIARLRFIAFRGILFQACCVRARQHTRRTRDDARAHELSPPLLHASFREPVLVEHR